MPPRRNKQSIQKKDVEQQKRILSAQERVLEKKRLVLRIIEVMIERYVSEKWILDNCSKLCHADYDDVVQERSIEQLCGYPLCSNTIKQTMKQKYQISLINKKVYDLTERKCFCSNQCYKASKYLKVQLSPIPLYMRKEEKIKVHLLSDCDNKGSAGEEVVFHQTILQDEIEKVYNEDQISTNLHNMLNEEVKTCADALRDLQIKEHVFEKQFVFGNEIPKKSDDALCEKKGESNSDSDIDSDDSVDEKFFPSYDNVAVLSEKHMPIPQKIKKSVLIPPLESETTTRTRKQELSLDFVFKVFKDWMTEDSMKYLLGEKYVYGIKADNLFEKMTTSEPTNSEKLSALKDEYVKLCLKIDSLPDDDDDLSDSVELDIIYNSKRSPVSKKINEEDSTAKKVFKRRTKGNSKIKSKHSTVVPEAKTPVQETVVQHESENIKGKHVTFAPEVKSPVEEIIQQREGDKIKGKHVTFAPEVKSPVEEIVLQHKDEKVISKLEEVSEEPSSKSSLPEPGLPLIDSVSQNALRRQVLISHLKSVYSELLPIIGLHYTNIRGDIKRFVETLSLTPTNIILKPKEWKLVSLVLYRILTKTVTKNLYNELQFLKLCEDPFIPVNIDLTKLEKIVSDLLCPENIINLK